MKGLNLRFLPGLNIYAPGPVLRYQASLRGISRFLPDGYLTVLDSLPSSVDMAGFMKAHLPDASQKPETRYTLSQLFHWLLVRILEQIYGREPYNDIQILLDQDKVIGCCEYEDEDICRRSASVAGQLLESTLAVGSNRDNFEVSLDRFSAFIAQQKKLAAFSRLHQTNREYIAIAEQRHIPWRRAAVGSLEIQLGYGCNQKHVRASVSDRESLIHADYANDKARTSRILSDLGYPVARQFICKTKNDVLSAARYIGFPVVIKPRGGSQGYGVYPRIGNEADLEKAFDEVRKTERRIILEQHVEGDDYRLMVVDGAFIGALHRLPPRVIGNGQDSIKSLIEEVNRRADRQPNSGSGLYPIAISPAVIMKLKKDGLGLLDVPDKNQQIRLSDLPNISQGGETGNANDRVHPDNAALAIEVAAAVGLTVAGVDFLSADISKPYWQNGAVICEVNIQPAVDAMYVPRGEARNFYYRKMFETMFPPNDTAAIPVAVFLDDVRDAATPGFARFLKTLWQPAHSVIGVASAAELTVAGRPLRGISSAPRAGEAVLWNPSVDAAIIVEAPASVVANGLGYGVSDFVVINRMPALETGKTARAVLDLVAATARKAVILNAEDADLHAWSEELDPTQRIGISYAPDDGAPASTADYGYSLKGDTLVVKIAEGEALRFKSKALANAIGKMSADVRLAFLSALTVGFVQGDRPALAQILAMAKSR